MAHGFSGAWAWVLCDVLTGPRSQTGDGTNTHLCKSRLSINHWTARKALALHFASSVPKGLSCILRLAPSTHLMDGSRHKIGGGDGHACPLLATAF